MEDNLDLVGDMPCKGTRTSTAGLESLLGLGTRGLLRRGGDGSQIGSWLWVFEGPSDEKRKTSSVKNSLGK